MSDLTQNNYEDISENHLGWYYFKTKLNLILQKLVPWGSTSCLPLSGFTALVTLTVTLDRVIRTAHCCASLIELYLHIKFHWNLKNFFVDRLSTGSLQVQGHVTQKPWPWPWIESYGPSYISHRPLSTYQTSMKLEKNFVDGLTTRPPPSSRSRWHKK